jgi:hypothetical protein
MTPTASALIRLCPATTERHPLGVQSRPLAPSTHSCTSQRSVVSSLRGSYVDAVLLMVLKTVGRTCSLASGSSESGPVAHLAIATPPAALVVSDLAVGRFPTKHKEK